MNPFLKQVARFLYDKYGNNLNTISVVFPGRRAGVFFNAYLNELVAKPLLGPEVITIDELISQLSDIRIADPVNLILRLYRVYTAETGHAEELDEFFFWGEILLNDFNDVDKYMLDADDLFRNINDLREIEGRFDYLTAVQKQALQEFWGSAGKAGKTDYRDEFLNVWNKLPAIYHRFREELLNDGIGYSGLAYRKLVENIYNRENDDAFRERATRLSAHYAFVGFNALNTCESKLLRWFKSLGRADFFWDYDNRFVDDISHEAGLFMRRNIVEFPAPPGFDISGAARRTPADSPSAAAQTSVLHDSSDTLRENIAPETQAIRIVYVSGQVAQAQVVNHKGFLPPKPEGVSFDDTALVLADEGLLIPVISAAGSRFRDINITMGYPLQNTPVFSLMGQLVELQKNIRTIGGEDSFYHKQVLAVLNHQLITGAVAKNTVRDIVRQNKIYVSQSELAGDDLLTTIFSRHGNWRDAADRFKTIIKILALRFQVGEGAVKLETEYLYGAFLVLQQLVDILNDFLETSGGSSAGDAVQAEPALPLFYRILVRNLQRVTIPFEGEPLSGLQVMGMLETRALDFKNLIVFSANEGKLPKNSSTHSFIPYNLRKAFGLPTIEEEDAIYAYYFYRLIHRAENVTLVFDSATDGLNRGEMSRYLFQLMYDSDVNTEIFHFDMDFRTPPVLPIAVHAGPSHSHRLLRKYAESRLSPSALNTYTDCKLMFYFKYLAGLREADEVSEDVDPRSFGNLFHKAVEMIYSQFKGKIVTGEMLKAAADDFVTIAKAVHQAFAQEYFKGKNPDDVRITGKNILVADNLQMYIKRMLKNDMTFAPFEIIDLEGNYEADFRFSVDGKEQSIRLGGIIDRIDTTDEGTRIVDYKTGRSLMMNFREFDDFYNRDKDRRPKEIFQLLIYSEILSRHKKYRPLIPVIYKIGDFFMDDFQPRLTMNRQHFDYADIAADFAGVLERLLCEMFSANNVYEQTPNVDTCRLCSYNAICRRSG